MIDARMGTGSPGRFSCFGYFIFLPLNCIRLLPFSPCQILFLSFLNRYAVRHCEYVEMRLYLFAYNYHNQVQYILYH